MTRTIDLEDLVIVLSHKINQLLSTICRHSAHLTPYAVSAAKDKVRVILPLDLQQLGVVVLAPEPPLPLPGVQRVLSLVEVGGGAVPVLYQM